MKKIKRSYLALAIGLALAFTAPQAASAAGAACGTVTGAVYTHGSERGMKIASSPDASAGGVSWDLAAPKNKFHDKQADIWLIGKDFNYDALSAQEIDDWYRFGKIPKDAPVYHTETNKNTGKYEFGGIPEVSTSSSSSTATAVTPLRTSRSSTTSSSSRRSCPTGMPSSSSTSDRAAASCRWSPSSAARPSTSSPAPSAKISQRLYTFLLCFPRLIWYNSPVLFKAQ